jgi:hypothetical protein
MLFVEPTQTERRPLPPGETTWSYYVKTVDAINDRLVADGRRNLVKLVGPNNSRDGYHLKEAVAELNKIIDIYSGHGYNKPGHADFLQVAQSMSSTAAQTGKPFWFDEYGISGSRYDEYRASGDYGTYLAEIVTATMNAGHQTSFFWELFDQLYIALAQLTNADSFYLGIQRTGTCKWPHDALVINPTYPWPSWYAFSLLSRYLGGGSGTRTLKTTGSPGLVVAATAPGDREFAVLVINTGKLERKFRVVFSSPVRRPLYRYPYSPGAVKPTEEARLIGYDRAFHKPGKNLDDTLGGRSFAIYTTIGGEGAASGRAASR